MNKIISVVFIIVFLFSCSKKDEKKESSYVSFYSDLVYFALKYPNRGVIKIDLPFSDSYKELGEIKNQNLKY